MLSGTRRDQEIHSGRVVAEFRQVNLALKDKESQKVDEGIEELESKHFLKGLGHLLDVGIKALLNNGYIGEYIRV